MSGTNASLSSKGGSGISLPAPKVQAYTPVAPQTVFVGDASPTNNSVIKVAPVRYMKITVPGLPQEILENISLYEPQVELLRYTRLNSREIAASGNGVKSGGFVHPSHGPAPSGNGSFTHGGLHSVSAAVEAIRPTEWSILNGNDTFDVTQGILGFMTIYPSEYRDNTGNIASVDLLVPTHAISRGRSGAFNRFPYSKILSGAYFAFRISVKDQSDTRGKRIWGPMSDIIHCGSNQFPFNPAGVDIGGRAQAVVHPMHDPRFVNFWHMTRQP